MWIISLLIVSLGTPAISPSLSAVSSLCGFELVYNYLIKVESRRKRFFLAFLWYSLVQAVAIAWMLNTTYHGVYTVFVYLGLLTLLGLQFGVFSLLLSLNMSISKIFALAGFWTIMEWSRLYFICGYVFNPSGLTLTYHPIPMQLASIVGVFGLTFLVTLTNLSAQRALVTKKAKLYSSLVLLPFLFGALHFYYYKVDNPKLLKVGLIQTGLKMEEKIPMFGMRERFINPIKQWMDIFQMVNQKDVDLLVLPESAVPFCANDPQYSPLVIKEYFPSFDGGDQLVTNANMAQLLADKFKTEVIIGLDHVEKNESFNSAFFFKPNELVTSRYDKQILMPLAEYLPLDFLKPLVAKYGIHDFFSKGKKAKVFHGKYSYAPCICYEECFGSIVRQSRKKGSDLIVNMTNDGWYPGSYLPKQHYAVAKLRAVENGCSLVRACNSGVSAALDHLGVEIASIESPWKKEILFVNLPTTNHKTLFTLWGDQFIILLSTLLIFLHLLKKVSLAKVIPLIRSLR